MPVRTNSPHFASFSKRREFKKIYKPICNYNRYQNDWIHKKMSGSINNYLNFIEIAKKKDYPIKVRFGIEVCYIPETVNLLIGVLNRFKFDFLTGSVHYIDGWGFDHKKEFWKDINVNRTYKRYYEIMKDLIQTGLFIGLAHPDSIKCFGYYPGYDLLDTYNEISILLNKQGMYAEQSGGLALNYGFSELGMNRIMLKTFKQNNVKIMTASDAHKPEHIGMNIEKLQKLIDNE